MAARALELLSGASNCGMEGDRDAMLGGDGGPAALGIAIRDEHTWSLGAVTHSRASRDCGKVSAAMMIFFLPVLP